MRIITGTLKGRQLPIPQTGEIRPTSDRAKEGLFSVIAARRYFEGCRVLDLFAGSGNLGFEALSRGADYAVFVDLNPEHIQHIEKYGRLFNVETQISTRTLSTEQFLATSPQPFDIIFSDPPYDYPYMQEMIHDVLTKGWLIPDGWFILEHDKRHNFENHANLFYTKPYGRTIVSMFQDQPVDSGK